MKQPTYYMNVFCIFALSACGQQMASQVPVLESPSTSADVANASDGISITPTTLYFKSIYSWAKNVQVKTKWLPITFTVTTKAREQCVVVTRHAGAGNFAIKPVFFEKRPQCWVTFSDSHGDVLPLRVHVRKH